MPEDLLLPMGALALWTLSVLTLIPIMRIRAARAGRVKPSDFSYGESANVPGDVSLPNRDYMNLLELPVLFYAACLAGFASHRIDPLMIHLAWGFVATRIVHSLIHLTYNNVIHRLLAFAAGVLVVLAMWLHLVWGQLVRGCWLGGCA